MTRDELCEHLDGNEIGNEIDEVTAMKAREAGFVIVFGASDDLVLLEGFIEDEAGYGTVHIDALHECLLVNECDDSDCPYFAQQKKSAVTIEALWCAEPDICWTYETKIPHGTFETMEEGEVYCRGIVFHKSELRAFNQKQTPPCEIKNR